MHDLPGSGTFLAFESVSVVVFKFLQVLVTGLLLGTEHLDLSCLALLITIWSLGHLLFNLRHPD